MGRTSNSCVRAAPITAWSFVRWNRPASTPKSCGADLCGEQAMKSFLVASLMLGIATAAQPDLPAVDTASLLRTAKPDLEQRLAQFKPVKMPFDASGLSARE